MNTTITLFLIIFELTWLIIPGLAVSTWLIKRKLIPDLYILPVALISMLLLGYATFWTFLISHKLGQILSYFSLALIITSIFYLLKERKWKLINKFDFVMPLIIMSLVSIFYISTTLACVKPGDPQPINNRCHISGITFDNLIPQIYAQNVYNNQPKMLIGDWQGSDRPPLQAAMVLLLSPITAANRNSDTAYLILSVILQCIWVPVVWLLGRRFKLNNKQISLVFGFCVFSGFFFFNSVFAWPKLLAGSLVLIGAAILLFEKKSWFILSLSAVSISLGFISHSAVIFTIIPIALIVLYRHKNNLRSLIPFIIFPIIICGPWLIYTSHYDPPGNRLVKWSVAGVTTLDSRSTGRAIADSYKNTGYKTIIKNKTINTGTLFGSRHMNSFRLYSNDLSGRIRGNEFHYLFIGIGLINIGWIYILSKNGKKRLKSLLDLKHGKLLLIVAFSSIALWVLAMFQPTSTVIHTGSYATIMILFILLSASLTFIKGKAIYYLLSLQIIYFLSVWVMLVWETGIMKGGFVALSSISLAGLLITFDYLHSNRKPQLNA